MAIEWVHTGEDAAVTVASVPFRWSTYVMAHGQMLDDLLRAHFGTAPRRIGFILGRGFDPRMNRGLSAIMRAYPSHAYRVVLLEFSEGQNSPSNRYAGLVNRNIEEFSEITRDRPEIEHREVAIWSPDGRRVASRSAANLFQQPHEWETFTDVVVDVSSLPRSIFYPLLAKLLHLVSRQGQRAKPLNLFVLVSENPEIDRRIVDEGVDEEADYVDLFRAGGDRVAGTLYPKVWIPLLGEDQALQLRRIHDLVDPLEICPVLPSPSLDPRRADNLVAEYHGLLFDQMRVEPQNFIYASERNPFEVYRQIRRTILDYQRVLQPLGGCRAVVSSVSSKLLSIGGLLAAYELKRAKFDVGIAHIEAQGYRIEEEETIRSLAQNSVLFGLWLAGECYE
jgi:hypothetical protein